MTQRHTSTTVRLLMALMGRSPVRAAEAGTTSGGGRIQPDQRQHERCVGYHLSLEQLAEIHGGIAGIKEKVHLPLYDSLQILQRGCHPSHGTLLRHA
jgi:hypothetical protein